MMFGGGEKPKAEKRDSFRRFRSMLGYFITSVVAIRASPYFVETIDQLIIKPYLNRFLSWLAPSKHMVLFIYFYIHF